MRHPRSLDGEHRFRPGNDPRAWLQPSNRRGVRHLGPPVLHVPQAAPSARARPPEIEASLSHLANEQHVSASTQNQALAALLFLYVHVLSVPLDRLGEFTRAKRPQRVPTVLTQTEVATCGAG
jgi:hypothetical protein